MTGFLKVLAGLVGGLSWWIVGVWVFFQVSRTWKENGPIWGALITFFVVCAVTFIWLLFRETAAKRAETQDELRLAQDELAGAVKLIEAQRQHLSAQEDALAEANKRHGPE